MPTRLGDWHHVAHVPSAVFMQSATTSEPGSVPSPVVAPFSRLELMEK